MGSPSTAAHKRMHATMRATLSCTTRIYVLHACGTHSGMCRATGADQRGRPTRVATERAAPARAALPPLLVTLIDTHQTREAFNIIVVAGVVVVV